MTINPPVVFDAEQHLYTHKDTGLPFPGCTSVLRAAQKSWLAPWMLKEAMEYIRGEWRAGESYSQPAINAILDAGKKAHRTKSDAAKETGTDAHAVIAQHIEARIAGTPIAATLSSAGDEDASRAFHAWAEWDKATKPDYLLSETPVCSIEHWYAGTFDVLCRVGGKLTLVDVKTSKAIYPEYFPQLAAYQVALEEWIDEKVEQRAILLCPKDGKPFQWKVAPYTLEADLGYFKGCLDLTRYNNRVEADKEGSHV